MGIVIWILFCLLAYGVAFGAYQSAFPNQAKEYYFADMLMSAIFSIAGPISLIAALTLFIHANCRKNFKFKLW